MNETDLLKKIEDKDFLFEQFEDETFSCRSYVFRSFNILRKNIRMIHLDGRVFDFKQVADSFYATYDQKRCELIIVDPLTGKTDEVDDQGQLANEHFFQPLAMRLNSVYMGDHKTKLLSLNSFNSSENLEKSCSKIPLP